MPFVSMLEAIRPWIAVAGRTLLATLGLLAAAAAGAGDTFSQAQHVNLLTSATEVPVADRVLVKKAERRLFLMRSDEVLRSYRIALGLSPEGPKERAGDFRTPEGRYRLVRRNARSDFFMSMQVSYPNDQDVYRARHNHREPGGSIMIHGLPNSPRRPPDYYATRDWTDGCIAVSNADMLEIWLLTPDNVPIEIEP
jgi:murein L,D-transpeptidase YafK